MIKMWFVYLIVANLCLQFDSGTASKQNFFQHNFGGEGVFFQNHNPANYPTSSDNSVKAVHASFQESKSSIGPTSNPSVGMKNENQSYPESLTTDGTGAEEVLIDESAMGRIGTFNLGKLWNNKPRSSSTSPSIHTSVFILTTYITTKTMKDIQFKRCIERSQFVAEKSVIPDCGRRKRDDLLLVEPSRNTDNIEITNGVSEISIEARGSYDESIGIQSGLPTGKSDMSMLDLVSSRETFTNPSSFSYKIRTDEVPTLTITTLMTISIPTSYVFETSTFFQKITLLSLASPGNNNDNKKDRLQCLPFGYDICD